MKSESTTTTKSTSTATFRIPSTIWFLYCLTMATFAPEAFYQVLWAVFGLAFAVWGRD